MEDNSHEDDNGGTRHGRAYEEREAQRDRGEEGRNVTEEIRDEREATNDDSSELSCSGNVTIQLMFQGSVSVSLDDLPGVREGRGGW